MYTVQRYRKVVFGALCIVLAAAGLYILWPFWQAIVWGMTLSILVYPIHAKLRVRIGETWAALLSTFGAILFIVGPIILVGLLTYSEIDGFVDQLQAASPEPKELSVTQMLNDANEFLKPYAVRVGVDDLDLKTSVQDWATDLRAQTGEFIVTTAIIALNVSLAVILLFFFLRDGKKLQLPAADLVPLDRKQFQEVLDSVYDMVHATFLGIVLVALVQGTVAGVAYWAIGVPYALLLGIATVILCVFPFVGAPFLWVPISILLASQGEWGKAIALAIVGIVVVGQIDTFLRPIIIGSRTKAHPAAVFFALIGGLVTLGPIGVIVGPVVLILSIGALQILRQMAADSGESAQAPASET